jgi:hypothetical protein
MRVTMLQIAVLLAWSMLIGCSKEASPPKPPSAPAEPLILGEWTTSNDPSLANMATTLTFRDSGEFRATGPLRLLGTLVEIKGDDGKDRVAPFIGSGTWEREGDRLTARVSTANVAEWKGQPTSSRIVKLTDGQLVLDHEGEVTTYFRAEPTKASPGAAKSP